MDPRLDGEYVFNPSTLIAEIDTQPFSGLRCVSQSLPHLEVPHFSCYQYGGLGGYTVRGFLDHLPDSTPHFAPPHDNELHDNPNDQTPQLSSDRANMPSNTTDIPTIEPPRRPSLTGESRDRNKSAVELSSVDQSFIGGLRKVASIANYDLGRREDSSSLSGARSHNLLSSSSNPHHHPIGTIHEDPADTGLMMTARSFTGGLISGGSSGGSSLGGSTGHGLHQTGEPSTMVQSQSPQKAGTLGGMMGMLGRGFFAKPVNRSEEENYRYIMALDR